jgi:glycosyltransferase involved in cell wall biosynthesis
MSELHATHQIDYSFDLVKLNLNPWIYNSILLHISQDEYYRYTDQTPFYNLYLPFNGESSEALHHDLQSTNHEDTQHKDPDEKYNGAPLIISSDNNFNLHGIKYFYKNILPRLVEKRPKLKLEIAGTICKYIEEQIKKSNTLFVSDNVKLLGFIKDIENKMKQVPFTASPTILGTGQKIKVQLSLFYKTPVVSFEFNGSSELINEVTGFVAKSDEEYVNYFLRLYDNRSLCRIMGQNASEHLKLRMDKNLNIVHGIFS